MHCPSCGKEIPDTSTFCLHCGTAIGAQASTPPAQPPVEREIQPLKRQRPGIVLPLIAALVIAGFVVVAVLAMTGPSVGNVLRPDQLTQFFQQSGSGASSGSSLPADARQAVMQGFKYYAQTLEGCPNGCTFSVIGAQRATPLSSGLNIVDLSNTSGGAAGYTFGPQDEVWCVLVSSVDSTAGSTVQYNFYGVAKRGLEWVAGPISPPALGVDAGVSAFRQVSCTIAPPTGAQ